MKTKMNSLVKEMFADKVFLRRTFAIALPVAFQSMLNMIVNLADTLMIGRLGDTPLAAVGLGNKLFFVYITLVFGISSGSSILTAQYYGNNDMKNIRRVLGIALSLALFVGALFTGAAFFVPDFLMGLFIDSPEVIAEGAAYLRAVAFSYPFTAMSLVYISSLRAMGEVKLPLVTSLLSIVVNVVLNRVLIFGAFGIPALGVEGAGLATLIARFAELACIYILLHIRKHPLFCSPGHLFGWSGELLRQFWRTAAPVVMNEFIWAFGVSIYSVAYGKLGKQAVAAVTIASVLQDLMFVGISGLAAATVVILGHEMGAGNLPRAKRYSRYFYLLSIMAGVIISLLAALFCQPFAEFYKVSPAVRQDVIRCLLVFALFFPFKAVAAITVIGLLRSGGDTLICFFLDFSGVWLIGIPLAFAGVLIWRLPVHLVYALVMTEEIYKVIASYIRYKQYKWLRNLNLDLRKE